MVTAQLETEVLVVGAGPTGLVLACELARLRVRCRLVERSLAFHGGSRAKVVQPRTLELLEDLGLIGQTLRSGTTRLPLRVYNRARTVTDLSALGTSEPRADVPYPNLLFIPQWRTEEILRARLAELGGAVELGREVVALDQDDHGVTATVRHVDTGATERLRAAYLVGCDGGHSVVRRQLGMGFQGRALDDHRLLLADVGVHGLSPDRAYFWHGADGSYLALYPLLPASSRWQVQASAPSEEGDTDEEPCLELLQRLIGERTGRSDIRLADPAWLSRYRWNERMTDRYRVGRAFVAGDAAHLHSPAGGLGMNTGMQDAANLGWKLAAVVQGKARDSLLDSYAEERMPVGRSALTTGDVGVRLMASSHPVGVLLRRCLGPVMILLRERVIVPALRLRGVGEVQLRKMAGLDLSYRGSSLSRDWPRPHGRVRAGDRAPDAPCVDAVSGCPVRLFDVFRGVHFTLLVFGRFRPDLARRIHERHGHDVRIWAVVPERAGEEGPALLDVVRHAKRAYGVRGRALVLVRPDGYVGFRGGAGGAEEALLDYLNWLLPRQCFRTSCT